MEPFAVSISAEALFAEDEGSLGSSAEARLRQELSELDLHADDIEIAEGSAGYGADGLLAVAILTGLAGLFLSGKKIEENLDAWVRLGSRLRRLVKRLAESYGGVSVSESVALALVVSRVLDLYPGVNGIEVEGAHLVPVANPSLNPTYLRDFKYQPDRVYIFVLITSDRDTFVAAVRSNGTIEFVQRLPTGDWLEYFGVSSE